MVRCLKIKWIKRKRKKKKRCMSPRSVSNGRTTIFERVSIIELWTQQQGRDSTGKINVNVLNCPVLRSSRNSGESSTPCCIFKPMQPTSMPLKNGMRLCSRKETEKSWCEMKIFKSVRKLTFMYLHVYCLYINLYIHTFKYMKVNFLTDLNVCMYKLIYKQYTCKYDLRFWSTGRAQKEKHWKNKLSPSPCF